MAATNSVYEQSIHSYASQHVTCTSNQSTYQIPKLRSAFTLIYKLKNNHSKLNYVVPIHMLATFFK
jgi:hypothetical protein